MEILGQLWWIVTVVGIIAIALFVPLRNKRRRERAAEASAAQYKQDTATLADFFDGFGRTERIIYMALPHRSARLAWLTQNHPEFMETISRHEPDRDIDSVVAFYLDVKLLTGVSTFPNRDTAIRAYQIGGSAISLNAYQEVLNKRVESQRKAAAARVMEQRKLEAAREEARREAQRQQSQAKKAAKSYWKSLPKEQQNAFKQAKGVSARKKVLKASPSTDLQLDTLYHLVMATQFNNINMNYNNAIDYCAPASKHTDSFYSPGRYDDGGSTHRDTSSPADIGYSHHTTDSSPSHSSYSSSSSDSYSSSSSSDSGSSSSCSFD